VNDTRQILPASTPNLYRLYRDVGEDSPWHDKALWQAITTLEEIANGDVRPECVSAEAARRLSDIEKTLGERP
jgi:hypothetical protein